MKRSPVDIIEDLMHERDRLRDAIKSLADTVEHEASFDDVLRKRISGSIAAARAALQEDEKEVRDERA